MNAAPSTPCPLPHETQLWRGHVQRRGPATPAFSLRSPAHAAWYAFGQRAQWYSGSSGRMISPHTKQLCVVPTTVRPSRFSVFAAEGPGSPSASTRNNSATAASSTEASWSPSTLCIWTEGSREEAVV
ncbi:uncharacterized protein Tco025E_00075 [Trypanosoma conorhini]|uniref:Uncharacterized protein n=1 Tax=Trypanosoma conorhini TaxID=83891 RepID=A0A422QCI7_9TRYP|nr:uncharacterized protein Tco025E_00075 [Trypanosoma conorhini]RNF27691.1 hypothetical protein Tco025E_00075 [Trypanosoma conorhini]